MTFFNIPDAWRPTCCREPRFARGAEIAFPREPRKRFFPVTAFVVDITAAETAQNGRVHQYWRDERKDLCRTRKGRFPPVLMVLEITLTAHAWRILYFISDFDSRCTVIQGRPLTKIRGGNELRLIKNQKHYYWCVPHVYFQSLIKRFSPIV